jgi:hypothetical protein
MYIPFFASDQSESSGVLYSQRPCLQCLLVNPKVSCLQESPDIEGLFLGAQLKAHFTHLSFWLQSATQVGR